MLGLSTIGAWTMPKETTYFEGKGLGLQQRYHPLSVRFPADILAILRGLENRQDYIRSAVVAALERDGLLPKAKPPVSHD